LGLIGSYWRISRTGLACQKLTLDPAIICFSPVFKMGSFGKNAVLRSMPVRHLHRQPHTFNGYAPPLSLDKRHFRYYDSHGGPIQFYADTIYQSIPGNSIPSGLYGLGCPFNYSKVGWMRNLFYTEYDDDIYTGRPQKAETVF
jgi:hypothetical protein